MSVLEWDQVGERQYETGVDHGVLYLKDGRAVPWNGIISVEDNTEAELKSYYLDGVKILDHVTPGEFSGKIKAFTYPEEFDEILGSISVAPGLTFLEQEFKSFNLSYRTKIGNDLDPEYGYKIHLLYNIKAISDSQAFETISDQGSASQFSWALTGTPPISDIDTNRPTVHIVIDSTNCHPDILGAIETIIYGSESTDPRFPTILEIKVIFGQQGGLFILDNGNGTWTAIDPAGIFVDMINPDTFSIDHANAVYLDADTYEISSTPIPLP